MSPRRVNMSASGPAPSDLPPPRLSTDVNECESSPCKHGGTCVDLVEGFRCNCPHGWEGNVCQLGECSAAPPSPSPSAGTVSCLTAGDRGYKSRK